MGLIIMQANEQIRKESEQCYVEFYRCMIERDFRSLSDILDDSFVLIHMTGMKQDKKHFIHAMKDGTLNYYSACHENIRLEADGIHGTLVGDSRVTAAVFGSGKSVWRLRLQMEVIHQERKWLIGNTVVSTY